MGEDGPVKILIDRNVQARAVQSEPAVREQTIRWGKTDVTSEFHGYRGKRLPEGEWLVRQIKCLPTIARLAKEGRVLLFSSEELFFESFTAARGLAGWSGDLFRGVKISSVPAAVERSYFRQTIDFGKHASGASQAEFYEEFLLKIDETTIVPLLEEHMDLPAFDLQNLRSVGRFRELCAGLDSSDHRRDAFHLWTAEANGLAYFLTMDRRFINVMTQTKKTELPTVPICPEDLLDALGGIERDLMPLKEGEFHDLFDESESS
jgi:hypothetical protein